MNNDQQPDSPAMVPAPVAATLATQPASYLTTWPGAFGIYKVSKQVVVLNIWTIVFLIIGYVAASLLGNLKFDSLVVGLLVQIIVLVVSIIYTTAMLIVLFSGVRNEKISISQSLKSSMTFLVRILFNSIIVGIMMFASILLFIIPFFFVFPRLVFTSFLIIDKNMGAVDSISASWEMSKGHVRKVYGIIGAVLVMALLSITIIGIPFSIYFIVMFSAAYTLLYLHINAIKPLAVQTNTPATPLVNVAQTPANPVESTPPSIPTNPTTPTV